MAMTVSEAGRKGGLSCLRRNSRQFYAEIGKKGQQVLRRKYPDMAPKWGKMGGRPRKPHLGEIKGQVGNSSERRLADPPLQAVLSCPNL